MDQQVKFLFRWKSKNQIPFSKLEIVHVFCFCSISTLEFGEGYLRHFQQMNFNWIQKVHTYLSVFINACSVVIKDFYAHLKTLKKRARLK